MKTIIHFFILLLISILFIACPPYDPPAETVQIRIKNSTTDSLIIVFYTDDYNSFYWPYWTAVLHSLPSSTASLWGIERDNSIEINNVFETVIKNKITGKRLIIVEELSKDTLAIWNDNSVVFTEQQFWTITEYYTDYDCTLELTDEVLKLK